MTVVISKDKKPRKGGMFDGGIFFGSSMPEQWKRSLKAMHEREKREKTADEDSQNDK